MKGYQTGYQNNSAILQDEPLWYGESQQPIQLSSSRELPGNSSTSQALTLQQNGIFNQAALEVFRDQCRAGLVAQVMNHTAALAALEAQCLAQAPLGEREYRLIMEAYNYRTVMTIVGSDW